MSYLKGFSTRVPQSEPLSGQVPNSAGGHAYKVDDWARMQRFLVLGSEGGTYYIGQRQLTQENAEATMRCIENDGPRAIRTIQAISLSGRAPKNDPAIFALAMAASVRDDKTRRLALEALADVCRTGTHLFTFASYVENFRGWGRGLRNAVSAWYTRPDLAYQLVKYRQRGGWSHRDLLRLAHPVPETDEQRALLAFATGKTGNLPVPSLVAAYVAAQSAQSPHETADLIREHPDLPREAVNPDHLTSIEVWEALLDQGMPMTALIRNLATMTRVGLLKATNAPTKLVTDQIGDSDRIHKARVHPLAVLVALKSYQTGFSARASQYWEPVPRIVDALDAAFYTAFGNVESSGKRILLALDVSSSMTSPDISNLPGITPRVGSAAMALITAATEPEHHIMAFASSFVEVNITPRQRLDDAIRAVSRLPFGGTDCALPMIWATQNKAEIDLFVVYTDSETWAGHIHPARALEQYRQKLSTDAKLAVVGMTSNGFTLADPKDPGMLDVVGFDTSTPNVLSQFAQS